MEAVRVLEAPEDQPCLGWRLVDAMDARGLDKPVDLLQTVLRFLAAGVPVVEPKEGRLAPANSEFPSSTYLVASTTVHRLVLVIRRHP